MMKTTILNFLTTLFLFLCLFVYKAHSVLPLNAKPVYIHTCSKKDPQLNECIKLTLEHIRPYALKGIPEIDLPSIEPLIINKLQMENGHGPVRMKGLFTNLTVYGGGNYRVVSVKSDLDKYRFDLGLFIPHIEVTGKYNVDGNVLLVPVRTHGDFKASFRNARAIVKLYGVEHTRNKITFLQIDRIGLGFQMNQPSFVIRDSINKNNVIGEAMNTFLNTNANEIIEEMKPAASQAVGKHFKQLINTAFSNIPLSVWLKD